MCIKNTTTVYIRSITKISTGNSKHLIFYKSVFDTVTQIDTLYKLNVFGIKSLLALAVLILED